jgi:hypothetical protein
MGKPNSSKCTGMGLGRRSSYNGGSLCQLLCFFQLTATVQPTKSWEPAGSLGCTLWGVIRCDSNAVSCSWEIQEGPRRKTAPSVFGGGIKFHRADPRPGSYWESSTRVCAGSSILAFSSKACIASSRRTSHHIAAASPLKNGQLGTNNALAVRGRQLGWKQLWQI